MAFNTGGAAAGAVGTGITAYAAGGPIGGLAGAAVGGLLGGLTGGDKQSNHDVGFSNNTQERSQRINQSQQQQQASQQQIAQDLQNYFLTGQYNPTWNNIPNAGSYGNPYQSAPGGPVAKLLQFGLNSEQDLAQKRQNVAMGLLSQFGRQYDAANNFAAQQLKYGSDAIGAQSGLYRDALNQSDANVNLQGNLFDSINQYIQSGGAPSQAQQQMIGGIYDSQRQIGQSNLNQGFGEALRQLQDQATSRGLRFGDTPIQDRGGLLAQEYLRNATNLESSIGGNQANALLQTPFQQQNQNLQALGQAQGSNLNVLNAFSMPINQAFAQQGQQFQQVQFGAQYAPAAFSGVPIQNLQAYLSGGSYAQPNVAYAPSSPAPFQPSFASNFANTFGASLGQGVGGGVSTAIGNLATNAGQNNTGSFYPQGVQQYGNPIGPSLY